MGDAHLRRALLGRASPTRSTARNLAKGQTGLSVAFDLPTQTGYDPDDALSRAARSARSASRSRTSARCGGCSTDIPLTEMNTSMTINATAMWLLALYQVVAEEQNATAARGAASRKLAGTTQNDIVKEYLSRGTYVFPPEHSMRLITDMIAYTVDDDPEVEPDQHLQLPPAGGRGDAGAGARLRAVHRDRGAGRRPRLRAGAAGADFGEVVGRISFFVNAGVRFVEEMCKMRAFVAALGRAHPRALRRRGRRSSAGSATACRSTPSGLTEAQPENNVQRIVLEMLGVTLSKDARARAVQLPAWNEALGLPRPWDQQWSLRLQQVLAFESDLLEYDDIFDGSHGRRGKVAELVGRRPGRDRPGAGDGRRGRRGRVRLHEAGAGRLARRAPRRGSRPARRSWSGSTGSRPPSPTR